MPGSFEQFDAAKLSDPGLVRERNEDNAIIVLPPAGSPQHTFGALLVVADGMGGMGGGATASQVALDTLTRRFYAPGTQDPSILARLHEALEAANAAVRAEAPKLQLPVIGSTAAGVVITPEQEAIAFNVGDCRVYRLRGGFIEQLTRDQSVQAAKIESGLLSEAEARAGRDSKVTAFLGQPREIQPVYHRGQAQDGDIFVICSDGLWDLMEPTEMVRIIASMSAANAAARLIALARERGAPDNVTAIVVRVGQPPRRRSPLIPLLGAAALLAVVAAAILLATRPAGTTAEITEAPVIATAEATAANQVEIITPENAGVVQILPSATRPTETPTEAATETATSTELPASTATPRPTRTPRPTATDVAPLVADIMETAEATPEATAAPAAELTPETTETSVPVGTLLLESDLRRTDFETDEPLDWLATGGLAPTEVEAGNQALFIPSGDAIRLPRVYAPVTLMFKARWEGSPDLLLAFHGTAGQQVMIRIDADASAFTVLRGTTAHTIPSEATPEAGQDWHTVEIHIEDTLSVVLDGQVYPTDEQMPWLVTAQFGAWGLEGVWIDDLVILAPDEAPGS